MGGEVRNPFTREQIEEQARGNLSVAVLSGIAYAKAQGQNGRSFATFVGTLLAPDWTSVTSPREAATGVALNCASFGLSVLSVEGDDKFGETVVTGNWPGQGLLQIMGLSQGDADQIWSFLEPVAQSLGYTFSWRREEANQYFTFHFA